MLFQRNMHARRITDLFEPRHTRPGATQRDLGLDALRSLRRAGLVEVPPERWRSPLPEADAARVRRAFAAHKCTLPDGPISLYDVFKAATGDADGDLRPDVDLGLLAAAGLLPAAPGEVGRIDSVVRTRLERRLPIGEDLDARGATTSPIVATITRGGQSLSVASGHEPEPFHLELGANGRGQLTLTNRKPTLRLDFSLRSAPRLSRAGRDTTALRERLVEIVLAAGERAPEGSPLHHAAEVQALERALRSAVEPPAAPHLAAIWRAQRVHASERHAASKRITSELGLAPRNYLPWLRHASDAGVLGAITEAARRSEIDPGLLFVTLGAEGLWATHFGAGGARGSEGPKLGARVDGFSAVGADTFGSRVDSLKAGGFLRPDFRRGTDYADATAINEKHRRVRTAFFADFPRAAEAVGAMLAQSRAEFLTDALAAYGEEAVIALSADQIAFFTSAYYNAGAKVGARVLARGLELSKQRWLGPLPSDNTNVRANGLRRLATLRLLQEVGVFSDGDSGGN